MKNTYANAAVALIVLLGGAAPITADSKSGKTEAEAPSEIPSPSGMPYPTPSVAQSNAKQGKERLRLRSATLCDLLDAAASPAAAIPDSSAISAGPKCKSVKSGAPTAGPSSMSSPSSSSITPSSSPSVMPTSGSKSGTTRRERASILSDLLGANAMPRNFAAVGSKSAKSALSTWPAVCLHFRFP